MARNETDLVKDIKHTLESTFGGFWFKVHGGPFQMAGIPDLVGCCKGRFFGVEVKLPGREAKLTPKQKSVIELIVVTGGGIAGMVTSESEALELVQAGLRK